MSLRRQPGSSRMEAGHNVITEQKPALMKQTYGNSLSQLWRTHYYCYEGNLKLRTFETERKKEPRGVLKEQNIRQYLKKEADAQNTVN